MRKLHLAILVILLATSLQASAHSGRTDSNGGHYDRRKGKYHYHHGMGPHQHINGICPMYAFRILGGISIVGFVCYSVLKK